MLTRNKYIYIVATTTNHAIIVYIYIYIVNYLSQASTELSGNDVEQEKERYGSIVL